MSREELIARLQELEAAHLDAEAAEAVESGEAASADAPMVHEPEAAPERDTVVPEDAAAFAEALLPQEPEAAPELAVAVGAESSEPEAAAAPAGEAAGEDAAMEE